MILLIVTTGKFFVSFFTMSKLVTKCPTDRRTVCASETSWRPDGLEMSEGFARQRTLGFESGERVSVKLTAYIFITPLTISLLSYPVPFCLRCVANQMPASFSATFALSVFLMLPWSCKALWPSLGKKPSHTLWQCLGYFFICHYICVMFCSLSSFHSNYSSRQL